MHDSEYDHRTSPGNHTRTHAHARPYRRYDSECDLWSLGVVAFVLLAGRPPFNGSDQNAIVAAVAKGEYKWPPKASRRTSDLCTPMLGSSYSLRHTLAANQRPFHASSMLYFGIINIAPENNASGQVMQASEKHGYPVMFAGHLHSKSGVFIAACCFRGPCLKASDVGSCG